MNVCQCGSQTIVYSVMQSDGNSISGEVVLDSFNISYRDDDNIFDKMWEKQISWDFFYEDLKFLKMFKENAYLKKYSTTRNL